MILVFFSLEYIVIIPNLDLSEDEEIQGYNETWHRMSFTFCQLLFFSLIREMIDMYELNLA